MERDVTPDELVQLAKEAKDDPKKELEAIAVGTAAVIAPIHEIQVGTVDPKSNEISEDGAFIQISEPTAEPEKEGRGSVSQLIFEALTEHKSGQAQQKLLEELNAMEPDDPKREELEGHLEETESYLNIIEAPKGKADAA